MKALVAAHWKSPKAEQKGNLWIELENYSCCVLDCSKTLGICVHSSVKGEPGNPRLPLCTLQKHHCDSVTLAERERMTINFMTDYPSAGTWIMVACQSDPLLFHLIVGCCLPSALFLVQSSPHQAGQLVGKEVFVPCIWVNAVSAFKALILRGHKIKSLLTPSTQLGVDPRDHPVLWIFLNAFVLSFC